MEMLYVTTIAAILVLCTALLFTARRVLRSSPLSSGELALAGIYDGPPADDTQSDERRSENDHENAAHDYESAVQERLDSVVRRRAAVKHVDSEAIMATWVPSPGALEMTEREFEEIEAEMVEPHGRNLEMPTMESVNEEIVASDDFALSPATSMGQRDDFAAETVADDDFAAKFAVTETPIPPVSAEPAAKVTDKAADREPMREKRTRTSKPSPAGYTRGLDCLLLGVSVLVLVAMQRGAFRHRSLESSHRVA